jgi:hypothetical protein
MKNGKIVKLVAHAPEEKEWVCRIPQYLAKDVKFNRSFIASNNTEGKYAVIKLKLKKGDNALTD